jgi:hypothetical protein
VFPATVLKEELPNFFREEFQAAFTTESSTQRVAGIVAQPLLGIGEFNKSETQENEFVKVLERQFQELPQQRNNKQVTTEFGGGVLDDVVRADVPSSGLDIEQGYRVAESTLRDMGDFGFIRFSKTLEDEEWPVLQGEKVEADGIFAGIRFVYDKQFVPAGLNTDGSGPPYTPNPGGFTDMLEHDKWRTIQITSRVDPSTLPGIGLPPIINATTVHLDLPATLLKLFGDFSTGSASDWSINPGSLVATADVQVQALGEVGATFLEGYRGPALGTVLTTFFLRPPTLADLAPYAVTLIRPAIGVALIKGRVFKSGETQQPDGTITESHESIEDRVGRISLRPALTRNFVSTSLTAQAPNVAAGQTGLGNDFVIFQSGSEAQATVTLEVPQSIGDEALASGQMITTEAIAKDWKLGVWVLEVTRAIIP